MKYKIARLEAKCSDLCYIEFVREDGTTRLYDGYVPKMFGGGDYVELDIDLETGQILNWKSPTEKEIDDATEIY